MGLCGPGSPCFLDHIGANLPPSSFIQLLERGRPDGKNSRPSGCYKTLPLIFYNTTLSPQKQRANCYEIPWRTNRFVRPLSGRMKPYQWERRRCQCAAFGGVPGIPADAAGTDCPAFCPAAARGTGGFHGLDRRIRMLREEVATSTGRWGRSPGIWASADETVALYDSLDHLTEPTGRTTAASASSTAPFCRRG